MLFSVHLKCLHATSYCNYNRSGCMWSSRTNKRIESAILVKGFWYLNSTANEISHLSSVLLMQCVMNYNGIQLMVRSEPLCLFPIHRARTVYKRQSFSVHTENRQLKDPEEHLSESDKRCIGLEWQRVPLSVMYTLMSLWIDRVGLELQRVPLSVI